MMVGLFFVGLQAPTSMQAIEAGTAPIAAKESAFKKSLERFNRCRKGKCTRWEALKVGRDLAIAAVALMVGLYVYGLYAAKGPETVGEVEKQQPSPEIIQTFPLKDLLADLENYQVSASDLVNRLNAIILGGEKLDTADVIKIGRFYRAQNRANQRYLQEFFLDESKIGQNYATEEAALKASVTFGGGLGFTGAVKAFMPPN